MLNPTERQQRALVNLTGDVNWREIVQWVADSLVGQSIEANLLEGERATVRRGGNLELMDILKHIDKNGQYLANARDARKRGG
jgi:hypothetical protein